MATSIRLRIENIQFCAKKPNLSSVSHPCKNVKLKSTKKMQKLEQKFQKSLDKNRSFGVE